MPQIKFDKNTVLIALFVFLIIGIPVFTYKFGNLLTMFGSKTSKTTPTNSQKPIQIQAPKVSPKPVSLQQGPFTCPSTPDFCKSGADINQNGKYIGFGAKIATGSAIYASFDGDLTGLSSTLPNKEKMIVLYIDNKDRGLRASYFFQGDKTPEPKVVKAGNQIGTTGSVSSLYNASLVFSITKNDPVNGDKIKLKLTDFK